MHQVDDSDFVKPSAALDNELASRASWLPAAALLLAMLVCYAVSVWVFRQKTIGGFAWVLPFFVAGAVGVVLYRRQCLHVGVLSDSESGQLGRYMSLWTALAVVLAYSVVQKSLFSGVASLFMGVPIFGLVLFGGIFVVKTMLLMQNHTERGRDDQLGAEEIAKIQADFRRDRGINDMPEPARADMAAPMASAARVAAIPLMPMPATRMPPMTATSTPIAAIPAIAEPVYKPLPVSKPVRLATPAPALAPKQDDDEIHRKVLEVRLRALKEQRKAEKTAAQNRHQGSR
jgi:UPF0716 family protein affecting phage T7 exclusion